MATLKDISGHKFNKLTALYRLHNTKGKTKWLCVCECGNFAEIHAEHLISGHTKSCGCLVHRHNLTGHKLHNVWFGVKARCYNQNHHAYNRYGGRDITMCDEWKNDFQAFYDWSINNGYKEGLQIDRIDNNGNYEPNNCRWVTAKENSNNRRTNKYINIGDNTHTLAEWCNILNLNYKTVTTRLYRGWSIEGALELNDK